MPCKVLFVARDPLRRFWHQKLFRRHYSDLNREPTGKGVVKKTGTQTHLFDMAFEAEVLHLIGKALAPNLQGRFLRPQHVV